VHGLNFEPPLLIFDKYRPALLTRSVIVLLRTEGEVHVLLEVFVDWNTAARLSAGKDQLRDILIVHIDGGHDLSVSLTTNQLLHIASKTVLLENNCTAVCR